MSHVNAPYPGTQSVVRAVTILKCFDEEHPEWRLADLARYLRLNKTTVFRLLSALESEGLIARSSDAKQYALGPEIVALAGHALRSSDLRTIARQYLLHLATATHETASLEIVSDSQMLIIDEVLGEHLVSGVRSLGRRWPLHGSSTGLAVLAAWPSGRSETYLRDDLTAITPHTITDKEELRSLLQEIRCQGYAVSDEMLEPGLVAIGAPIRNLDGHVEAAISVYGPKSRLQDTGYDHYGELVLRTASDISERLGYAPVQTV